MALIPSAQYPAQTDTDSAYPQGKARNASTFQDGTGTPLEKSWVNDLWGFLQALLARASITPSGNPDQVGASQYIEAVDFVATAAANKGAERVLLANWSEGEGAFADLRMLAWVPAWGLFILAADIGDAYRSPDGKIWTAFATLGAPYGLAANPSGTGVAVYGGGLVRTSPDGATWTNRTSGTVNELRGVVWTGSLFIAVGAGGTIITSPDGITWTTRTSGTANQLESVASNGSLHVAVGLSGTIVTSPNGTAWTVRTSGTTDDLYSVAWSPTSALFVAVGESGKILTSPNGVTWTTRTSGTTSTLRGVTATDNYLIAAGSAGALHFSINGIAWQRIEHLSAGGNFDAIAVAWSGTICVAAASSTQGVSHSLARLP